jgi:RNA polymerase sigma factor (sigma-70 family)
MGEASESLLERCARGDERAWGRLVSDHAGLVFAIARSYGLPEESCEDVAQTVFAALLTSIATVRHESAIPGWLRTATNRECWRTVRSRRRSGAIADEGDVPDLRPGEDLLDRLEMIQRLRLALEALGGRCAQLLRLLHSGPEATAYDRVAQEMQMPRGSIGPTRRRCLEKLAALMQPGNADG